MSFTTEVSLPIRDHVTYSQGKVFSQRVSFETVIGKDPSAIGARFNSGSVVRNTGPA
jgi:hypothetical protein